jgi:glycine cleavage system aminomethyltransferase T
MFWQILTFELLIIPTYFYENNSTYRHTHCLGAKMVDFAGFYMPVRYSSDLDEHHCVRNAVGMFDVSHMGEFILKGEKALPLLQKIVSNDVSKLERGQALYGIFQMKPVAL